MALGNWVGLNAAGTGTIGNLAGIGFDDGASGDSAFDNVVSGNQLAGILIGPYYTSNGDPDNLVQGNLIGTDPTGTLALGNVGPGVLIYGGSADNTIGGTTAGAGNLISGGMSAGVSISGTGTSGNLIMGNYVGTNAAGTAALGNSGDGVEISAGASDNWIGVNPDYGVEQSTEGNLVSGNTSDGVEITGSGTTGNTVAGNYIGTDVTGTVAIANDVGVEIDSGATANLIGTSGQDGTIDDALERNVISGNSTNGIEINGTGTETNVVAGNYIGLSETGSTALANGQYGIELDSAASSNWIGVNLKYGPEDADQRNVISGNTSAGIYMTGSSSNVVAGNYIGTDPTASLAIPNLYGVYIDESSSSNLVGTSGQDGSLDDALERNVISGNTDWGVTVVHSSMDNVIAGNYVGTNAAGTVAVGSQIYGVSIGAGSQGNWVGVNPHYGPETADQRNVISGNTQFGVIITGLVTSNNTVAGNYIGTDVTGTLAVPNQYGVYLQNRANHNLIGSNGDGVSDALERNIISGNSNVGIYILASGTDYNVVAGNYVGTDVTGTLAVPNGTTPVARGGTDLTADGIAIEGGASYNLIGTNGSSVDNAGERNVVSGNDNNGVEIGGNGSDDNVVAGNYLGLTASGSAPLGNNQAGLLLYNGATANTIGGVTATLRNVMGGNANRGIYIDTLAGSSTPTTANVIEGNYIGTDASGLVPMSNNANDAISIDLSPGNIIGGTVAGAGNVLDAGDDTGIYIYGDYARGPYASAAGTLIAGNIIGLAADGVTATGFGNGFDGIVIDSAPNTTIGGSVAAARNIISNNTGNQRRGHPDREL